MKNEITLYHIPPSFYSQIVRVVLREKKLKWKSIMVAAGPPFFDNYEPWYVKLNPNATVPTLSYNEHLLTDSLDISYFLDRTFNEEKLIPDNENDIKLMNDWIFKMREISFREITYGSSRLKHIGKVINHLRIRNLKKVLNNNPDLSEIYENKIEDIQSFSRSSIDSENIKKIKFELWQKLDKLNLCLENKRYLAGENYSLADVHWTVAISRLQFNGCDPLKSRTHLNRWYLEMKRRDSFSEVWEQFKFLEVLPVILKKLASKYLIKSTDPVDK